MNGVRRSNETQQVAKAGNHALRFDGHDVDDRVDWQARQERHVAVAVHVLHSARANEIGHGTARRTSFSCSLFIIIEVARSCTVSTTACFSHRAHQRTCSSSIVVFGNSSGSSNNAQTSINRGSSRIDQLDPNCLRVRCTRYRTTSRAQKHECYQCFSAREARSRE